MSVPLPAAAASAPSLASLPPELLSTIFSLSPPSPPPLPTSLDPHDDHPAAAAPLRLHPSAVAISRALVPFARANAYACVTVRGRRRCALLGERLREGEGQGEGEGRGGLVRVLEVLDDDDTDNSAGSELDSRDDDLERAIVATLDAVPHLEHLVVACTSSSSSRPSSPPLRRALLSPAALSSRPFCGAQAARLSVVSCPAAPLCVADLARGVRGAGEGLREVEVVGRMALKRAGAGAGAAAAGGGEEGGGRTEGEAGGEGVRRVVLEVEPHAQGLGSFLDALPSLAHLSLRCFTTDAAAAFSALTPQTRARLREVEFSSSGYLHRPLCALPSLLPSLSHLTLSSPALILTPDFLAALSNDVPLVEALVLRGPHVEGERAAGERTLRLLAEWVEGRATARRAGEHGAAEGERAPLRRLEVDVRRPPAAAGLLAAGPAAVARGRTQGEGGALGQARRLAAACARAGVALGGGVVELLRVGA